MAQPGGAHGAGRGEGAATVEVVDEEWRVNGQCAVQLLLRARNVAAVL